MRHHRGHHGRSLPGDRTRDFSQLPRTPVSFGTLNMPTCARFAVAVICTCFLLFLDCTAPPKENLAPANLQEFRGFWTGRLIMEDSQKHSVDIELDLFSPSLGGHSTATSPQWGPTRWPVREDVQHGSASREPRLLLQLPAAGTEMPATMLLTRHGCRLVGEHIAGE